jgi:hypothetical protein
MKHSILLNSGYCLAVAATLLFSLSMLAPKKASAFNSWIPYAQICPGGQQIITVCGAGGSGCFPQGTCAKE